MLFEDLYDCCFKNITVRQVNTQKEKSDDNGICTLGTVFSSSRYVLFCLINSSSERTLELFKPLQRFVAERNNELPPSSAESPARIRRFFGVSKKSKKKRLLEVRNAAVAVLDVDDGEPQTAHQRQGWYWVTLDSVFAKSRLLRALHLYSTPSLVIVDASTRQIITTDGKRLMQEDPNGKDFPWWNPSPDELFRGEVLKNCKNEDGTKTIVSEDFENLASTVKGLYFGANWCPPCRSFTRQLLSCYSTLKSAGLPFEIFFCSSDRSKESFEQHFSTMPWLAFPYDQQKLNMLTRLYNVNGIPSFLILDGNNRLITRHGRNAMMGDPHGKSFPWGPQMIYELHEHTLCRLRDEPSLVLFTEGSPEDVSFSMEVLRPTAEALFSEKQEYHKRASSKDNESSDGNVNGSEGDSNNLAYSTISLNSSVSSDVPVPAWADPLQIFYTGEDPLCDLVLEGLGLGNAELPVIVIVDATVGRMCICEKPDVSAEIIAEFVADYRSGKTNMEPLPTACQTRNVPAQVGGIPTRAIYQALGIGSSPSQNSITNENVSPSSAENNLPSVAI